MTLKQMVDQFEKVVILIILGKNNWHISNSAREMAIHRKTLEYKMKKLKLRREK